ncbi:MAG TPA: acetamidase/formamidase family protein [Candidatus Salinicoccus stercoripullorum]|uniref:Acetamidase/formamidase family protein n=1 Tax=Candidatus Salinicoccus stercoripullorum TaxID=2838756 RepID=A0A9D1QIV7_9STAP|nr:acetamidase/formamidase family protein [Candidatus Salinicoccus stercoripullorum]
MHHKLNSSHLCYEMSSTIAPALEIDAGDTVQIRTVDCFENQITAQDMDFDTVDWSRQNPATGPVFVRGLSAGDVLKATIEKIELDGRGLVTVGPQGGVMRDYIEERHVKFFDLDTENNTTEFNGMTVPLNPMIGVIGNAPAAGPVPNSTPGAHGGNMDCRKMTEGAVLYLPVFHDGALFGLGDVHAKMGDGEVGISGLETAARVTVRLEKASGISTNHPVLIDEEGINMMVSRESLDEAVDESVRQMIKLLRPQTTLSLPEIAMLMSLIGETQINQVVDPLKTARFFVPYYLLEHYSIDFGMELKL